VMTIACVMVGQVLFIGSSTAQYSNADRNQSKGWGATGIELYEEAKTKKEQALYERALDNFQRAEKYCHSPYWVGFIGGCQDKLGDLLGAAASLWKASHEDFDPKGWGRDDQQKIREMRTEAGKKYFDLIKRVPRIMLAVEGRSDVEILARLDDD